MHKLIQLTIDLDINNVKEEVNKLLSIGTNQKEIFQGLLKGLDGIGKKYELGEYYIGELIVAGMLMKDILAMEGMKGTDFLPPVNRGKFLVGTVLEDIHDIGKGIMIDMLTAMGFEVVDLGVDVSPDKFAEGVLRHRPHIVGISCVLTVAVENIFKTIKAIEQTGLRESLKIIVGGAALDKRYFSIESADAFTNDAYEGIQICEKWIKEMNA